MMGDLLRNALTLLLALLSRKTSAPAQAVSARFLVTLLEAGINTTARQSAPAVCLAARYATKPGHLQAWDDILAQPWI